MRSETLVSVTLVRCMLPCKLGRLIASDAAHSIGNRDDRREVAEALRKARVQTPGHRSLAAASDN